MADISSSALATVSKAVGEAAGKAAEQGLQLALAGTVLGPAAPFIGAAVASVVKAVIEQLGQRTSGLDRKVQKLLDEPLSFATQTIEENLVIDPSTRAELAERGRQLHIAFDKLRVASIYTGKDERSQALIEFLQAVASALMPGGRVYAERRLAKWRHLVSFARSEAALLRERSEKIDPNFFHEHMGDMIGVPYDYMDFYNQLAAVEKCTADAEREKAGLLQEAAAIEGEARRLEATCRLVEALLERSVRVD